MGDNATPLYLVDWPSSLLIVRGSDRASFLHNVCTADVLAMQPGDAREALFTSVKGHVLAHGVLYCRNDSLHVLVLHHDVQSLSNHLDRYIIREDVQLEAIESVPRLVVGAAEKPAGDAWQQLPLAACDVWVELDNNASTAPVDDAHAGGDEDFATLRVQSAWPLAGVDYQEGTLPQELNRNHLAISFTKGCYLGQETVARIDALGHVNKHLVLVESAHVEVGMQLHDGDKLVGTVTSAANVDGRNLGIAMVRRGSNAVGQHLQSAGKPVTIVPPPHASD